MKKLFLKTFIILGLFVILTPNANADWFSIANGSSATKKILKSLGFDIDEIKNAAQYFNVSRRKKDVPSVDLTFTPTNPSVGEKITATAATMNFVGESSQIYFTWYIRHDNNDGIKSRPDFTLDKNIDCDGDGNCDRNDDDDIDVEDWKIEAMRIIANGGFDWEKAKKSGLYSSANESAPLSGKYEAIFGGESQRGKYDDNNDENAHCFYHDFDTGDTYEFDECIHLFPNIDDANIPNETGNNDFTIKEKEFWHTNPLMPDTAGTGFSDEANVTGLGATQLSWNYQEGDEVGVAVEGAATETTTEEDTTYKVMWALPKNKCDIGGNDDAADDYPAGAVTPTPSTTTTSTALNGDVTTVLTETYTYNIVDDINKIVTTIKTIVITTTVKDSGGTTLSETIEDSNGAAVVKPLTFNTDEDTFDPEDIGEVTDDNDRVLPSTREEGIHILSLEINDLNDCLEDNLVNPGEGGDNKMLDVSLSYLPKKPMQDSAPGGANADELNITASVLGSKNNDLKYTWEVYGSNEVNPTSWDEKILTKRQLPGVGQTSGINLSSLKFRLNFTPEILNGTPIPEYLRVKVIVTEQISETMRSEGNADIIIPIASVENQIHVYPIEVIELGDIAKTLKLSIPSGAKEKCNAENEMEQIVCPVANNEIVSVSILAPDEIGSLGAHKADFSNILWTLDGAPIKPLSYANGKDCLSGECLSTTGEPTNIAYFPVLKEKGERYSLSFTAVDEATKKKVSLLKTFEVADPEISIISADENICRPEFLGNYIDLDGKPWPDYSEDAYQAVAGSSISLKPEFNMSFVDNKQWYIDGVAIDANTAPLFGATVSETDVLTFPANKLAGEIYSIAYSAFYKQDNNIKKILNDSFNVQLNEFYEKQLGDSIEVLVVDAFNVADAQKITPKKFLASLASNVPAYLNFLFRIALTIGLFLFVSRIIFSLFPKTNYDE